MMNNNLEELREEENRLINEILKIKDQVLQTLKTDLSLYPLRELKKRYLQDPEFGNSFSKSDISLLKQTVNSEIKELIDDVIKCMDDDLKWIEVEQLPEAGKSFEENKLLWECISILDQFIVNIMKRFNYPEKLQQNVGYKMPTWFIGRVYLPGLAQKYWKLLSELRTLKQRYNLLQKEKITKDLSDKWEDA